MDRAPLSSCSDILRWKLGGYIELAARDDQQSERLGAGRAESECSKRKLWRDAGLVWSFSVILVEVLVCSTKLFLLPARQIWRWTLLLMEVEPHCSQPHSALLEHKSIHVHTMTQWPKFLQNLPWIFRPVTLLLKPLIQFLMLLWFLIVRIHSPAFFIVQNPPSVPTLIAVKWASILKRSAFIIDWHNFGHTLLALSLGRNSSFVAVYRWIEKHFGKMADGSFCVTKAMQHELAENWDIKATVFYDQPPEFFHVASLQEKHELFCRLHSNLLQPLGLQDCVSYAGAVTVGHEQQETLLTSLVGNGILLKQNRPAVVVSSTSWTPDEDFSILLEAAVMYDRRVAAILNEDDSVSDEFIWKDIYDGKQYLYPRLLFIITGKGPDKEKYEDKISKLHLKRVETPH
ncbi:UDP-glycosyltransferase TURAN, partial [Cucurbita argyrosperma subsp. sororia]